MACWFPGAGQPWSVGGGCLDHCIDGDSECDSQEGCREQLMTSAWGTATGEWQGMLGFLDLSSSYLCWFVAALC